MRNGNTEPAAMSKEVADLLMAMLSDPHAPSYYLAVDAFGESVNKPEFLRFLHKIPPRHKILMVSREDTGIRCSLSQLSPRLAKIDVSVQNTKDDIEAYIFKRLAADLGSLDAELEGHIQERLMDCDGMFLWVRLMIDHLLVQTTVTNCVKR